MVKVKVKYFSSTPYRHIEGIGKLGFNLDSHHRKTGNMVTKLPLIIVGTLVTTKSVVT